MADNKPLKFYSWKEIDEILTAWSKEQEEYADYWMKDKTGPEAYKTAMKHLRYHLKNPIKEII